MQTEHPLDAYQALTALLDSKAKAPLISIVGGGGKTHTAFYLAQLLKAHGHRVCVTTTTKMFLPVTEQVDHIIDIASLKTQADVNQAPSSSRRQPSVTFLYQEVVNRKPGAQTKLSGSSAQELDWVRQQTDFDFFIVEADGARNKPLKAPARHEPCIPDGTSLTIAVTGAEALLTPARPENIHRWDLFSELTGCKEHENVDAAALKTLLSSPKGLFQYTPAQAKRLWIINKMDRADDAAAIADLAQAMRQQIPELDAVWLTELQGHTPIHALMQGEASK